MPQSDKNANVKSSIVPEPPPTPHTPTGQEQAKATAKAAGPPGDQTARAVLKEVIALMAGGNLGQEQATKLIAQLDKQ